MTCEVEGTAIAPVLTITGVTITGEDSNVYYQGSRLKPAGRYFNLQLSDGRTISTASTSAADADITWNRIDTRADSGNPVAFSCADESLYTASSGYPWYVGPLALTVVPNPDYDFATYLGGAVEISPDASATWSLNIAQSFHLVDESTQEDVSTLLATQYEGSSPDFTGVKIYAKSTGGSGAGTDITSDSHTVVTPSTWSATGTQTLSIVNNTFGKTPLEVEVSVQASPGPQPTTPTVTSLTITGTPTGTNVEGDYPDFTGLTWTFGLDNGQSVVKTYQDYNDQFQNQIFWTMDSCSAYDAEQKWDTGSAGTQTVTFNCAKDDVDPSGNWWLQNGYQVATPEPTASVQITVTAPL